MASFAQGLPAMVEQIEGLLRCESPSADLAAVTRSADLVAALGEEILGAPPERIVIDGCPHLRWRLGSGRRRVLVVGHHDTVWPIGSLVPHPAGVVDGHLLGPGCVDMKAGVVIGFHAVAALADPDGVTILVTGDEEIGSRTSRALVESEAEGVDGVLVLEAAADGGALKIARKGISRYEVHVAGRAAHAGLEPDKGINASIELAHQTLRVAALADPSVGTTVTPTTARAGTASNTVPADATLAVDVRAATRAEQERVHRELHLLRPVLPGAQVTVSGEPNRPPFEATASTRLFAHACAVADRLGLPPLTSASVGGASDGNFTAGIGAPTLDGLGAVGGGPHAADEHVIVAEIPARTALVAALIDDLLGGERLQQYGL